MRGWEALAITLLLLLLTWGEITVVGRVEIRKAFQDLLADKARLQDVCAAEGVGLCGGGSRAASGETRLVPHPRK